MPLPKLGLLGRLGGLFGKSAAEESSVLALKALGKGSTGRTTANNLVEQMAMDAVVKDPTIGKVIMTGMKDSRWLGWSKFRYSVTTQNGQKAVVHYVGKIENGVLKYVDDFKFK